MKKLITTLVGAVLLSFSSYAQPHPPDTLWTKTFGGSYWDYGCSIQQTSEGGYIIAGCTYSYGAGSYDVYLIKTGAETSVRDLIRKQSLEFRLYDNYPNPFNASTVISFELRVASDVKLIVYDVQGREVQSLVTGHLSLGYHKVVWNAEGFASGVYFARLESEGFNQMHKLLLIK